MGTGKQHGHLGIPGEFYLSGQKIRKKDPCGLEIIEEILGGRDVEKMIPKFCDKPAQCWPHH